MSDFLKINRNGQILEIVLDRLKANALDAPSCRDMNFYRFNQIESTEKRRAEMVARLRGGKDSNI